MDGNVIVFSNKFCNFIKENLLETLDFKYSFVIRKILLLDEWVYLTSGNWLIEN